MTTLGAAKCRKTGDIYYCSDSLTTVNNVRISESVAGGKFIVGENCAVGFSGSISYKNAVESEFSKKSAYFDVSDPYEFLEGFYEFLRSKERFNFEKQVGSDDYINFNGIFLSPKGIFTIYGNFTYMEHDEFAFMGSGEEFAIGAFEALTRAEYGSVRECLEESVNIATKFDSSSGGKLITAKLCVDK